jgi:hypothetical protein
MEAMNDAITEFFDGFRRDRKLAWWDLTFVLIVAILALVFMFWYAVPIPASIPEQPALSAAVEEVAK